MKILSMKGSVEMTCPKYVFLQKWLKNIFVKSVARKRNRKKSINSYKLSSHLMNDLGFDRDSNPLQWSTFSKNHPMAHEAHRAKAKRTNVCVTDCDDKHLEHLIY